MPNEKRVTWLMGGRKRKTISKMVSPIKEGESYIVEETINKLMAFDVKTAMV